MVLAILGGVWDKAWTIDRRMGIYIMTPSHFEKLINEHIEAAKHAGLPGTAEVIENLLDARERAANERERMSKALTKLAMEVHALGVDGVPKKLFENVNQLLRKGDLSPFLTE